MTTMTCPECSQAPDGQACSPEHADLFIASMMPFANERDQMQHLIDSILRDYPIAGNTTESGQLEHCYSDRPLMNHLFEGRMNVETGWWRLLIEHPRLCGCDSLTSDFVLHG